MAIHIMDAGAELFQNNPVHFSSIENYISDTYLDRMKLQIPEEKKKPVAVIGAGPAGLTVAIILAQHGYKVTIFEQQAGKADPCDGYPHPSAYCDRNSSDDR